MRARRCRRPASAHVGVAGGGASSELVRSGRRRRCRLAHGAAGPARARRRAAARRRRRDALGAARRRSAGQRVERLEPHLCVAAGGEPAAGRCARRVLALVGASASAPRARRTQRPQALEALARLVHRRRRASAGGGAVQVVARVELSWSRAMRRMPSGTCSSVAQAVCAVGVGWTRRPRGRPCRAPCPWDGTPRRARASPERRDDQDASSRCARRPRSASPAAAGSRCGRRGARDTRREAGGLQPVAGIAREVDADDRVARAMEMKTGRPGRVSVSGAQPSTVGMKPLIARIPAGRAARASRWRRTSRSPSRSRRGSCAPTGSRDRQPAVEKRGQLGVGRVKRRRVGVADARHHDHQRPPMPPGPGNGAPG